MKLIRCAYVLCIFAVLMGGCSFLDTMSGFHQNPDGSVTVDPQAPGKGLGGLLGMIPVYGALASGLFGSGLSVYNHFRILKAGKKDDNWNGVPDEQEKPPAPPPAAPAV